jgi:hypothetical protein
MSVKNEGQSKTNQKPKKENTDDTWEVTNAKVNKKDDKAKSTSVFGIRATLGGVMTASVMAADIYAEFARFKVNADEAAGVVLHAYQTKPQVRKIWEQAAKNKVAGAAFAQVEAAHFKGLATISGMVEKSIERLLVHLGNSPDAPSRLPSERSW